MSEYSHCSICGGSFVGIGNVCPGCENALSREPLEIRPIERKTRNEGMSETVKDIITEARGVFAELRKHGHEVVSADLMESIIDRIEAAAHNNPTCINCVAVEKWKAKQAAAKAKKEADHD